MATVIFYEKPGCINNTKQKALLEAAGHTVEAHNLLTEDWSIDNLRLFFGSLPVSDWFNRSAPMVKSGEIVPEQLDAETALSLMIQNPLLIRRPLIQIGNQRSIGFEVEAIETWIGLQPIDLTQQKISDTLKQQDLQNCPRGHSH
ncbi:ArsC/Spx/MgsR family protein [Leptolyngbya sp. AN03gr2]|uniref:ArsC/Spx/MgsR family protein n=1 Tax=unclassified Leptolyngbya TaxID=2650499 RepID=UPI003D321FDE